MPISKRDIIVIGGSAGAIPVLLAFVKSLPIDFAASIFIVQHVAPFAPSRLPQLLSNAGHLKAVHPKTGDTIKPSLIYLAPPDHHLLIESGKVIVARGPKENRFRPSIDALFRSAAYIYGPRVIGLVLSGSLNDGTSGLWTIKQMGGMAVVQDPEDATFPDMPASALEHVNVDYSVRTENMADLLVRLAAKPVAKKRKTSAKVMKRLETEILIATRDNAFEMGIIGMGELTPFTCPECNGALSKLKEGSIVRFRCHTGHAFTISALLSEVSESVEELLWQAMRGLEETNMLLNSIAQHFESTGRKDAAKLLLARATQIKRQAQIVHDSVLHQQILSGDIAYSQATKGNTPRRKARSRPPQSTSAAPARSREPSAS
jgi:two-component system, chemotaxis family, protein-glutamate methylesterase/glutaminase